MITLKLDGLRCLLKDGNELCATMDFSFDGTCVTLFAPKVYSEIPGLDFTDALQRTILSAALERGITDAIDIDGSKIDIPNFFKTKQCGR